MNKVERNAFFYTPMLKKTIILYICMIDRFEMTLFALRWPLVSER